jgi:hypothetical protein
LSEWLGGSLQNYSQVFDSPTDLKIMKKHTKIYIEYFGYTMDDFIPCEVCGARAVDIHHIDARGMGGSDDKDTIENLMAVCRKCHVHYGDVKMFKDTLINIHKQLL